jgi:hypothetical protein
MRTRLFIATVVLVLSTAVASATPVRTFVSSTGLDANPCSRTSPCRSFNAALLQTSSGGSIIAIDSAGYGTITIGQSVSIIAPEGVYAGISAASGNAIAITGTTTSDVVVLRGLSIEGLGSGNDGVQAGLLDHGRCRQPGERTRSREMEPPAASPGHTRRSRTGPRTED